MFSSDLDKARNFIRDGFNAEQRDKYGGSVLWALFRTHEAMNVYTIHAFGAHPSVAAQYLDFLVNSKGEEASDRGQESKKLTTKFEARLNSMEQTLKETKSAAGTASNGLAQLKAKVDGLMKAKK